MDLIRSLINQDKEQALTLEFLRTIEEVLTRRKKSDARAYINLLLAQGFSALLLAIK